MTKSTKVMTRKMLTLSILHLLLASPSDAVCNAASSAQCALQTAEDDSVTLLQVSSEPAARVDKATKASKSPRQAELQGKIDQARAFLQAMESELQLVRKWESSEAGDVAPPSPTMQASQSVAAHAVKLAAANKVSTTSSADISDGSVARFIAKRCPEAEQGPDKITKKSE